MDLMAYTQIEDLDKIAKSNNIEIPRLRGYRLMKNEQRVSSEEVKRIMEDCAVEVCKFLCCSDPFWNANSSSIEYSTRTDKICDYYLVKGLDENGYTCYTDIRWDRIHGRKRKILKFAIKKQKRRIQKQFDMWNKYVGNKNVLYIHARIGGRKWEYYGGNELIKLSWFLDKADDYYDGTYCDIYALIK